MSWKKYFKPVPTDANPSGAFSPLGNNSQAGPAKTNYSSYLPDVYAGAPNRIERYIQYDTMDMDPEVNAALDILTEFCTQKDKENATPFSINFRGQPTSTEVKTIKASLQKWSKQQKFANRIFRMVRNTFKYGDCIFIRDPETLKWLYVDMAKVSRIIVNESEGKIPEQYVFKDINFNFINMIATTPHNTSNTSPSGTSSYTSGGGFGRGLVGAAEQPPGSRFQTQTNEITVDAKNVIHISLSEGLDDSYPFGRSLLESVFKVYKQKELLEDAIIIYRIQRAPERRIFYIDVGNMPAHMAMGFVERVKNEIQQRRIPSATGGGANVVDASYNPLCLDLDTKIPLLDGRTLLLSELISEFEEGKENWTYSCDPETGKIVPGVINWAGITRKNAEVLKLTFDNGKTLVCTPDHKIPVFGKGFVEAKDIKTTDSLISFCTKHKNISSNSLEYEQVWDHSKKAWVWTHRLVGEFFRKIKKHQEFTYLDENIGKAKTVIHHKDYNRFNNDPRNIQYMNKKDHILYHASQKKEFWANLSEGELKKLSDKISNTLKDNWKNMSESARASALYNIRKAQKTAIYMRQTNEVTKQSYKEKQQKNRKNYFFENPGALAQAKRNLENRIKIKNQPLELTFEMLQIVVDIVRTKSKNKNKVISLCDANTQLLELVKKENAKPLNYKNAHCKIDFSKFGYSKLDRLIEKYGYNNWKHFVKEIDQFNHKVVKIETISNRDTGTITIDGEERWHNYHTFAIDSGIFVKNSTNEDYFFPQTSEGRGSKVDTLPGGTNLGEITDLRYFTNKLFRALRIPASYLPTTVDEAPNTVADGKVGTAYIQELRFNEYCKRLQNIIVEQFDIEFKLWLNDQGVNIDSSLFELKFNNPQNFAAYRQAELDTSRVSTFASLQEVPYLSKRFALKRFLGLTQEEITENETLWREENNDEPAQSGEAGAGELRGAGITPADISTDMADQEAEADMDMADQADTTAGSEPPDTGEEPQ